METETETEWKTRSEKRAHTQKVVGARTKRNSAREKELSLNGIIK